LGEISHLYGHLKVSDIFEVPYCIRVEIHKVIDISVIRASEKGMDGV